MLPNTCRGCPLWKSHAKFVRDKIPDNPKLIIYYDFPASTFSGDLADETQEAKYFQTQFLPFMDMNYNEVGYAHLFRCKGGATAKGDTAKRAKEHCRQYDDLSDESTIAAPGFLAWQYFTNRAGSRKDWGGYYVDMQYNGRGQPLTDRVDDVSTEAELEQVHNPFRDRPNPRPTGKRVERTTTQYEGHFYEECNDSECDCRPTGEPYKFSSSSRPASSRKEPYYATGQPCPPGNADGAWAGD